MRSRRPGQGYGCRANGLRGRLGFFDGVARHTEEGHDFVRRSMEGGFKQAVRERDEPFGDYGLGGSGVR